MTMEEFIEQIEESSNECVISEIEQLLQNVELSILEKESKLNEALNQIILKRYQLRHAEEKSVGFSIKGDGSSAYTIVDTGVVQSKGQGTGCHNRQSERKD